MNTSISTDNLIQIVCFVQLFVKLFAQNFQFTNTVKKKKRKWEKKK